MIDKSTLLTYYKRKDIQEEIIANAKNREIAIKFGDKGFGQRPDILQYPGDILELAKQGATSFHASEELWSNPLRLTPDMKRRELEDLRIGWDLVIDIDSPIWHLSKITAWLIIKSLKEHNIISISVKFSGNKGFHIGVPFEAFKKENKTEFPEIPKKIALYLLDYIGKKHVKIINNELKFGKKFKININKLSKTMGKSIDDLSYWFCTSCEKKIEKKSEQQEEYILSSDDIDFINEPHQKKKIKKETFKKKLCSCKNPEYIKKFNPASIIDIDTILISSRHLYRTPYSLHEKSGLASIPTDPEKILNFDVKLADPNKVKVSKFRFLDKSKIKINEASNLLNAALAFHPEEKGEINLKRAYDIPTTALPEKFFPPCMKKIIKGDLEDGKKRSLFTLINFLSSVGWSYDKIESFLKEWNKKNKEPLRDNYLFGQLRYHKQQKKKIPPANCDNSMYYKDLRFCIPDNLCNKIKNPVNYSRRRVFYLNKSKKQ